MIFWAATEIFQPAAEAHTRVRKAVELYLNAAFAASSLASLDCKLRYVPIVMPEGMRERYPARSGLSRKERVYNCCPQLNYDVFVGGSFEEQLEVYLRGIVPSGRHLAAYGATKEQITEFESILATAAKRILIERPDHTRH